ncbi:hypothetical protein ACF08W_04460 [Streptomyces sp. NPDC015144]|uniref:hypothetical protein n=1 Tax=Streptomyces sp. NPDC015144 TaxID=3364944 RepID=UPI0036F82F0B
MQKGRALVVRQEWEPKELISVWTPLEEDMGRLRNKSGANRLGFALLLKCCGRSVVRFGRSVT